MHDAEPVLEEKLDECGEKKNQKDPHPELKAHKYIVNELVQ